MPAEYDGTEPRPGHAEQGGRQDTAMVKDRVAKMLRQKRLGASWDTIAKDNGYADGSGPRQIVLRALDEQVSEHATALRTLENQRLDVALQAMMAIVTDTNRTPEQRVRAADAITRNSHRRARLNGLDAPVQVAVGAGSLAELDDAIALFESVVRGEVVESHDEPAADDGGPGSSPALGSGTEGDD